MIRLLALLALVASVSAHAVVINDGDGASDSVTPISITPTTSTGGSGLRGYYSSLAGKSLACSTSAKPGTYYVYTNGNARVLSDGTPQIRAYGSYASNGCDTGYVTSPSASCTFAVGGTSVSMTTVLTSMGMQMTTSGQYAPPGCSQTWPLN